MTNVKNAGNELKNVVIVRGGGDLASGTIQRLYRCGYRVLVLECEKPTAIRRMVSFCEAVYDGQSSVEGVLCRKVNNIQECETVWTAGEIPLMVDTAGDTLKKYRPAALVDAILAKRNLGTTREMADLTVALGPGFVAGDDVDYVVETMRGHNLARVIAKGAALPNTGVPGVIAGFGKERVLHAPAAGEIHWTAWQRLEKWYIIVSADIDPRKEQKKNCFTISDKARCIAGSVVEILLSEGVMPYEKTGRISGTTAD